MGISLEQCALLGIICSAIALMALADRIRITVVGAAILLGLACSAIDLIWMKRLQDLRVAPCESAQEVDSGSEYRGQAGYWNTGCMPYRYGAARRSMYIHKPLSAENLKQVQPPEHSLSQDQ